MGDSEIWIRISLFIKVAEKLLCRIEREFFVVVPKGKCYCVGNSIDRDLPSFTIDTACTYGTVDRNGDPHPSSHTMTENPKTLDERTLRSKLAQYGFSKKEIETYLAVVEFGGERASTIAERANVSESYVYSIFDRLEESGFIVVEDHRNPTVVRPRPPSDAFGQLYEDLLSIESTIEERYEQDDDHGTNFELINARATVTKRLRSLIEAAQSEVLLQLPVQALSELRRPLERALDRGLLVLLVLSGDADRIREADVDGVATVVRSGIGWTPTLLAIDQTAGVVASNRLLQWEHGDEKGLVFEEDNITPVLTGAFLNTYWPMADELAGPLPPSFPRSYDRIRPAVFDATVALKAGRTVHARLHARPTLTDQEYGPLKGHVRATRQPMLEPRNAEFGLESTLFVDIGGDIVSVGGKGCFLEAYEAISITLTENA